MSLWKNVNYHPPKADGILIWRHPSAGGHILGMVGWIQLKLYGNGNHHWEMSDGKFH